jgi:hypothetical protein
MRHDFAEAARIFQRSADHSFLANPPHIVGGFVSRCLQFRASYLEGQVSAEDFRMQLQQAGEKFESEPENDFARRWVMNYHSHLFELAFAEENLTLARKLLEGIQRSRWMRDRTGEEQRLRILPYSARIAMLENDWEAAARHFEKYLDVPNPVWNSKAGEALAREFLDYGIALAERHQVATAQRVWRRGLECPDNLANRIWKASIQEAQRIAQIHGSCWPHLSRPLLR